MEKADRKGCFKQNEVSLHFKSRLSRRDAESSIRGKMATPKRKENSPKKSKKIYEAKGKRFKSF